uniref:Uncharacterized protein n=1 Tax=Thermogemmatispora argillosa TaxID=2045280 RepID=A0A455SZC2_9CHLR|nr:hypothetical protein KTA_04510 [Thermogemmatispora argillosa]
MKPLDPPPSERAPWRVWSQWVSDLVQVLGTYELPLTREQLRQATSGLAQLEERLQWEQRRATVSPVEGRRLLAGEAARMHWTHLLRTARCRLDECRLLLGTLVQRTRAAGTAPGAAQAGVAYPDRLRQRVRRALEQFQEQLEQVASLEDEAGGTSPC